MSYTIEALEAGRIDLSDVIDPDGEPVGPIHPGRILLHDFLEPLDLSARALNVPANRISGIVKGERAITADTAMRLARYFGTSVGLWLNLQKQHDIEVAQRDFGAQIEREVQPRPGQEREPKAAA